MSAKKLRILAIEPEADCRDHLRSLLAERITADVVLTATAEAAASSMRADRPDLVLLSAVLPPRAEEHIVAVLKELDPDVSVPVLTIPPIMQQEEAPEPRRGIFGLLSKKDVIKRLTYDPSALTARIGETLTELRQTKEILQFRLPANTPPAVEQPTTALARTGKEPKHVGPPVVRQRKHQQRAHRLTPDDLPNRYTLTTPAGFIVRLLNVSASGVLFESPLKFTPESATSLNLFGPETNLELPARVIRSEVSGVNTLGVTYQTAAAFSDKVELMTRLLGSAAAMPTTPKALADLLLRVTGELQEHHNRDEARAEFERGMRVLVPTCDVRLRDSVERGADNDSIYFTVPSATPAILQATFDPGHEPTLDEFKFLRAAATAASLILQHEVTALTVVAQTA
jgi:hypothetical protein